MSSIPKFLAPSMTLTTNHFPKNIDNATEFGMLTPTQLFSIFNEFINWPEYENSSFVTALENAIEEFHIDPECEDDSGKNDVVKE
jgi:dimethyladenosine transferase 2